jgi:hypothetical protein
LLVEFAGRDGFARLGVGALVAAVVFVVAGGCAVAAGSPVGEGFATSADCARACAVQTASRRQSSRVRFILRPHLFAVRVRARRNTLSRRSLAATQDAFRTDTFSGNGDYFGGSLHDSRAAREPTKLNRFSNARAAPLVPRVRNKFSDASH